MCCLSGEGTVLSYSDTGSVYTAVACSVTISGPKMEISSINCSTLADTHKHFRPSLISDPGSLDVEGFFDPSEASAVHLFNLADVPEMEYWKLEFSDGSDMAFTGFLTSFEVNGMELEGNLGFSASIKISGQVVLTPAV